MTLNEVKQLAVKLAQEMPVRIYALTGELGAGKTTFTQFFLRALGVKGPITSPTFVIIKRYTLRDLRFASAYHIDCYRLQDPHELLVLGFKEIIENPKHIVIIEWADRVRDLIPGDVQWINFQYDTNDE